MPSIRSSSSSLFNKQWKRLTKCDIRVRFWKNRSSFGISFREWNIVSWLENMLVLEYRCIRICSLGVVKRNLIIDDTGELHLRQVNFIWLAINWIWKRGCVLSNNRRPVLLAIIVARKSWFNERSWYIRVLDTCGRSRQKTYSRMIKICLKKRNLLYLLLNWRIRPKKKNKKQQTISLTKEKKRKK